MKNKVTLSEALAELNSNENTALREGTTSFNSRDIVTEVIRRVFDMKDGELTLVDGRVFIDRPNGNEPRLSALVVSRYDKWYLTLMRLKEFVRENGCLPQENGISGEHGLWEWCDVQKRMNIHRELSKAMVDSLEAISGWIWKLG